MKKVAADLAVAPVIYIPCFYMATGLLTGLSIEASAQRLSDQFRETITAYVSLWPGAVFLVFRLVPEHHRILTMAAMSGAFGGCCFPSHFGSRPSFALSRGGLLARL